MSVNATGMSTGPSITSVNVISVPTDTYLSSEDMERIRGTAQMTEHAPQLEPIAPVQEIAQTPEAFEPQTARERRLLAELEALTPEQLLERARAAGYVDADCE